ncbi:hypothetical protein DSO57_1038420 [Entomophthora muscae]|uniref:Uncharacterized protein n=1 Tax=Entomophthora muscae TaxID=34485 RepID=A0ACC2SYR5_9FUNG|nr:hypothetical protein DSO57_1038420 [Entomophthora muscae]
MEPPVTPKPMPASSPDLPTDHTGKLFGIVYITLTGVIDSIILAAGPWSWVRKSISYLFKLAPLLWWSLPAKNSSRVTPGNDGLAAQDWIPGSGTVKVDLGVDLQKSWVQGLTPQIGLGDPDSAQPTVFQHLYMPQITKGPSRWKRSGRSIWVGQFWGRLSSH